MVTNHPAVFSAVRVRGLHEFSVQSWNEQLELGDNFPPVFREKISLSTISTLLVESNKMSNGPQCCFIMS